MEPTAISSARETLVMHFFNLKYLHMIKLYNQINKINNALSGVLKLKKQIKNHYHASSGSSSVLHKLRPNSFWLGRHEAWLGFFQMAVLPSTLINL
jgi:hypothetical protein